MSLLQEVRDLRQQFKTAFLPVPAHPDSAPPQGAPVAPPSADPNAAMAAGPPPSAPPSADPNAAMPPGADPNAAPPGPPPVNPDIMVALQEVADKLQEFGQRQAVLEQQSAELAKEVAHQGALRDQRKQLINDLVQ